MHSFDKLAKQLNTQIPDFNTVCFDHMYEIGIFLRPDFSIDTSRICFQNIEQNGLESVQVNRNGKVLEMVYTATFDTVQNLFKEIPSLKKSSQIKIAYTANKTPKSVQFVKNDTGWVFTQQNKQDKRKYKIIVKPEYEQIWKQYRPYAVRACFNDKTLEGFYCIYNTLSKKGYDIIKQLF